MTAKLNRKSAISSADAWPVSALLIGQESPTAVSVRACVAEGGDGPYPVDEVETVECEQGFLEASATDVALFNPAPLENGDDTPDRKRLAALDTIPLPLGETRPADNNWPPPALRYIARRKPNLSGLRLAADVSFEEKERARVALELIGDAVLMTDTQGNVIYLNRMGESMTGWPIVEALAQPLSSVFNLVDGLTGEAATNPALCAINEDRMIGPLANRILFGRDGNSLGVEYSATPVHDCNGKVTGAVIVFRDVNQSVTEIRRMAYLARHDSLTGLPNRALFTERLEQAISLAQRQRRQVALLFLDLDYFKRVNDSLGHGVGDQALCAIAHRLAGCVRKSDTVCRLGGDEFVVLLEAIDSPDDAAQVAETVLAAITTPLRVSGHTLQVSASVGISIHPEHGADAEAILRHADAAMYHAKTNGRARYGFFEDETACRTARRPANTHAAVPLDSADLGLHYHAQFDLVSGRVVGAEALLRMADQQRGLSAPPGECLPVAEQAGLSLSAGQWVLFEVCRQRQAWLASGLTPLPVSINVSAAQFRHAAFVDSVREAISASGVDPGGIVLGIPEAALAEDTDTARAILSELGDTGVQLAINQFGTGNLGLLHLKGLPVQVLKIGRACVRSLDTSADGAVTMNMLLALGKSLGHRVIAYGVDTAEQLAFLQDRGCDAAQGFYLHHPLCGEGFARLLSNREAPISRGNGVR